MKYNQIRSDLLPGTALTCVPEGKRKESRPGETWKRTFERERCEMAFRTWAEAEKITIDRKRWNKQQKPYTPSWSKEIREQKWEPENCNFTSCTPLVSFSTQA